MIGRVERLTWRGHGEVPVGDARWYLPGVEVGEVVEFTPIPEARLAQLIAIQTPAPTRIDPACAQAPGCPGCPLRHLDPTRQASLKASQHAGALARIAALAITPRLVGAAPTDAYRARARARPIQGPDGITLGLGAHPGHPPIALADCPAQTAGSRALLRVSQRLLATAAVPWALDQEAPGALGVEVEGSPEDGRISLLLSAATWDAALRAAAIDWPGVHLTRRCMGPRGPGPSVALHGPAQVGWRCEDDALVATHPAWRPHSPASVPALRRAVLDALEPAPDDAILELGCGIGTLSLPIARRCARLLGVDIIRQAAADAQANAQRAGLDNCVFQTGAADRVVRRLLKRGRRFDRVVVHMMRRPLGSGTLRELALLGARRVIYLAPSVASLARDLADRGPWQVSDLAALDQLPGTTHLLSICQLDQA